MVIRYRDKMSRMYKLIDLPDYLSQWIVAHILIELASNGKLEKFDGDVTISHTDNRTMMTWFVENFGDQLWRVTINTQLDSRMPVHNNVFEGNQHIVYSIR